MSDALTRSNLYERLKKVESHAVFEDNGMKSCAVCNASWHVIEDAEHATDCPFHNLASPTPHPAGAGNPTCKEFLQIQAQSEGAKEVAWQWTNSVWWRTPLLTAKGYDLNKEIDSLAALIEQQRAQERERCIKLVEDLANSSIQPKWMNAAFDIVEAMRDLSPQGTVQGEKELIPPAGPVSPG